ncbi:hypothetical protein EMCRGX_G023260 [Ephydatia muelleri]
METRSWPWSWVKIMGQRPMIMGQGDQDHGHDHGSRRQDHGHKETMIMGQGGKIMATRRPRSWVKETKIMAMIMGQHLDLGHDLGHVLGQDFFAGKFKLISQADASQIPKTVTVRSIIENKHVIKAIT